MRQKITHNIAIRSISKAHKLDNHRASVLHCNENIFETKIKKKHKVATTLVKEENKKIKREGALEPVQFDAREKIQTKLKTVKFNHPTAQPTEAKQ